MLTEPPVGVRDCGTLEVGIDAYYKIANDLIDNGNFGQALVLSAFNYAKGYNKGVELKAKFTSGNFQAYVNFAAAQQRAPTWCRTNICSITPPPSPISEA